MTISSPSQNPLNIQFLLTGTELMVGDIIDTNSVMLAQSLKDHGAEVNRKVTLGDDFNALVNEIEIISQQADVLIINGGLGPTEDDLTAAALAKVIAKPLVENATALAHLQAWCEKRGFRLEGANRKQIILPKGIQVIANPVGSAVGFSITHNDCKIYCTPGVPSELKEMWLQEILPRIKPQLPSMARTKTVKLHTFGIGESAIQNILNNELKDWPQAIEVGFRAAAPLVELKLTTREESAEKDLPHWQRKLEQYLAGHWLDSNKLCTELKAPVSMAQYVVSLLSQNNQSISVAESCTGGLIAANLTRISGSSKVFEAGYVTYSNRIKTDMLNVQPNTLNEYGAVSEKVVIEMAQGALKASSSDWVIAVSGIAGPSGGSEEKPVGTVWLCWGNQAQLKTKRLVYPTSRINFQRFIANAGLDLIRREILAIEELPSYFAEKGK